MPPVLTDASEIVMLENCGTNRSGGEGIFCHLNLKLFAEIIGNTEIFSNFTFGYDDRHFID